MRKDMAKVLVTRARLNEGHKYSSRDIRAKHKKFLLEDQLPLKEGMRMRATRALGYDRKILNEFLNPLKRYLISQVGRAWNAVYSDICANLDRRSAVQVHIFEHLEDFVELHPKVSQYRRRGDLFVDAQGILQIVKKEEDRYKPAKRTRVELDHEHAFVRWADGSWKHYTYRVYHKPKDTDDPKYRLFWHLRKRVWDAELNTSIHLGDNWTRLVQRNGELFYGNFVVRPQQYYYGASTARVAYDIRPATKQEIRIHRLY